MLEHNIVKFLIMPKPSTFLDTIARINRRKFYYLNGSLKNADVAVGPKKIFPKSECYLDTEKSSFRPKSICMTLNFQAQQQATDYKVLPNKLHKSEDVGVWLRPTISVAQLCSHSHMHLCIPHLGSSIWRPPYWGSQLSHFYPLWLSAFPLLASPPFPPLAHTSIKGRSFCQELLISEMIPPIFGASPWSSPCAVLGDKMEHQGAGSGACLLAFCLHCHSKWKKAWLLLSLWLIVLIDHTDTWWHGNHLVVFGL